MSKHIIFGAPGTGKTTTLMNTLEDLFRQGFTTNDICLCTYTKSGAEEAKERAVNQFGLNKKDIPFFGTIHSICFKSMGFESKVISGRDRDKFFTEQKISYQKIENDEDLLTNEDNIQLEGNILLNFYDKLRLNFCKDIYEVSKDELRQMFYLLPISEEDYNKIFNSYFEPYQVLKDYESFKRREGLIDFIDMLLTAYKKRYVVPTKILFVDEFQDLSPLQYELYKLWCVGKKEVYIAGDDDQTIYRFICADSKFLLDERKSLIVENGDEEIVLPITHRLLSNVHEYCSEYIKSYISKDKRVEKIVKAKKDGGEVIEEYISGDLERTLEFIREDKFTFILFRTNYQKREFIDRVLVPRGIIYHEIRGQSIWNARTINLFNACIKIIKRDSLSHTEVKYLVENIPFKHGYLKKGLKSKFKELKPLESYSVTDLLGIGFDMNLFNLNSHEKIYSILDLNEKVKQTFIERQKTIIEYPIRLKLGTMHSSKGKEADDVILFKDVSKRIVKSISSSKQDWEAEMRVFYVGMTRAKERLVILRGGFGYSDSQIIP